MPQLHGEYDCKLDAKGRLKMPATLLRQLGSKGPYRFFINRGYEKHLMIYPEEVWEENLTKIRNLNVYKTEDRSFIRYFFRGVTDVLTDAADRILVGKPLLEYAGIEKEVILFAYLDKIEMWSKEEYGKMMSAEPEDFAELAEKVLGKSNEDG